MNIFLISDENSQGDITAVQGGLWLSDYPKLSTESSLANIAMSLNQHHT